jgi:hypothetical protein
MGIFRFSLRYLASVVGVLLMTIAFGCDDTSNEPTDLGATTTTTQIALSVPTGWSVLEVGWIVEAADGSTLASGTENVPVPQQTLSLGLVLPVGHGEVLSLQALTANGTLCSGTSDPFDVVAGAPGSINLSMVCDLTSYTQVSCPNVLVQGPTPSQATSPNGTVSIVAIAESSGTNVPAYSWAATGGYFSGTNAGSTLYTCSRAGAQTIFLTVSYAALPDCSTTFLLPVSCL